MWTTVCIQQHTPLNNSAPLDAPTTARVYLPAADSALVSAASSPLFKLSPASLVSAAPLPPSASFIARLF